jgi:hypothetical protein
MDFMRVLTGQEKPLEIYELVSPCIDDITRFPDNIEPIYREVMKFDEESLDRFRFALLRVQIYADVHHNEDLERAQKMKYVAQTLEKVVYGSLLMEPEEGPAE